MVSRATVMGRVKWLCVQAYLNGVMQSLLGGEEGASWRGGPSTDQSDMRAGQQAGKQSASSVRSCRPLGGREVVVGS